MNPTQEMIKRLFLSIAISVAALIAGTNSVTAAVTRCNGPFLDPGTYDAVLVPKGKECSVVGDVTVEGNVILQEGASLIVQGSGFTVNGNLQGNGVSKVTIQRSPTGATITIHGNVSITGATGEVDLFEVIIGGNLKISGSNGGPILVQNSQVSGNALFQKNTTDTAFGIIGNTIVGNLVCNGNDPAPVVMNSTTSGQMNGQCSQ
jgi:hypothetical protein